MEIEIRDNVPRPKKKERFEFGKIPVNGGLVIRLTGKETLKSVAAIVKGAVTKFKKLSAPAIPMNLSVHVLEDFEGKPSIIVRHNELPAVVFQKGEKE